MRVALFTPDAAVQAYFSHSYRHVPINTYFRHPAAREGTAENVSYSASAKRSDGMTADAGTAVPLASAELSIQFTSQGGYVFEALAMKQLEIADRLALAASLLQAYEKGQWQKEWLLVDSLYYAGSATILVSEDAIRCSLASPAWCPCAAVPIRMPTPSAVRESRTSSIRSVGSQALLER